MSIPIRITTKIECPCGASYRYGEDGPDGEVYEAWVTVHSEHWSSHSGGRR